MVNSFTPVLIVFLISVGFVTTSMVASHLLGPKRHSKTKDSAFECGIESKSNARVKFSVRYFLIAILFVLFDVEVILFYPWAVTFKELGQQGLIEICGFIGVVLIALLYLNQNNIFNFEAERGNQ
ncbi:NADH-quinone oxidoreductase subunit A [bacterium]|nr:NADH-quinone oxidoreductase subunit A [bacterium]